MLFDENDGYLISDLNRRLSNIIRIGIVFAIDYDNARARVKIGDLETDFLPWINANSGINKNNWNPPEIDEQVIILSINGELNQGIILASLYKNNTSGKSGDIQSITYKNGSEVSFNHETDNLELNIKGDVTLNVDGTINLGGLGGKKVARIGDEVEITSGSSAGRWKIISGSSKVKTV